MMRTFRNTFTAGLTGFTVNNCYSVYNMNCIKRTSFYTASKSHTSIIACFGSAAWNECHHFTVFYTSIVIIVFCFFAGSCTFYKGSHTSRFNYFLSHDSGNYFAYCFSAYRTGIDRCFAFCDCSSKTITSRITAATTVVSRKCFADCNFTFICFDSKFFAGNTQENTNKETDSCNNYGCCNNCSNIHNVASLN